MSGLVAIINLDGAAVDRPLFGRLTDSLEYLGRDRKATWIDGHVGLGHTLHKTTNEADYEIQPCTLDGNVWLIAHARIDARRELVNKLELQHQINLETTPDPELILRAYYRWGEQCLAHLIGDFAFILWDARTGKLLCARDRFGACQLYYARIQNSVLISNSIYCLLHHPGLPTRLNDQVMGDFLLFGNPIWLDKEKDQTVFECINRVPPAHQLIIKENKYAITRYWDIPRDIPLLKYRNELDYVHHFQDIFKTAVSERLRYPDIVVSMSGGLDSTSIAATVGEISQHDRGRIDLKAITISYDRYYPDDEPHYAKLVADKLGMPIRFIAADHYPFLESSILTVHPMELYQPELWMDMHRNIASMSRVCLTGDAGDNLLSPTPLLNMNRTEMSQYHLVRNLVYLYKKYRQLPAIGTGINIALRSIRQNPEYFGGAFSDYPAWLNRHFESNRLMKDRWKFFYTKPPGLTHPRHSRMPAVLTGPDWSTDSLMADAGFVMPEARDPYLDTRLLEFILSLPPLPWLFSKHLLRSAMQGKLPAQVLDRSKTGMGDMLSLLVKQSDAEWIDNWTPVPELNQYVERHKVPKLLNGIKNSNAVVSIRPLILNKWLEGLFAMIHSIKNAPRSNAT